ncbi:MAG: polyprenyl synthetase family protein [Treponema sp.]|jgi:octaprenyl-diphosphate synthase|nr:polyprenyl synthetase family protein [Treponema sp.]
MRYEFAERLDKIETFLDPWLPSAADDAWVRAVFPGQNIARRFARQLIAPARDLLERGGKRWRPLLSLLVCEALGGGEAVLPLLPLVEFSHNASLIHDDIEDNSAERRGKPALHLLYGEDTAINSGAFLYFLPLACLEAWDGDDRAKNAVGALWARHMRALHLGQSMDIAWHRGQVPARCERDEFPPNIAEYETMCALKTGSLARFAALLGAETALGPKLDIPAAKSLALAAEKLGVGFQIIDDVKNLTTGLPGKQRGDDIVEGKMSLPILSFLWNTAADDETRRVPDGDRLALVRRCFAAARKDGIQSAGVETIINALEASGSLEEAAARGRTLIAEAKSALAALPAADQAAGRLLAELPDILG